jgi:anti-sigma regulatory factor (Ser/Thr protein kinase)
MNTLQIPNKTGMLPVLQSFVVESARVDNLPEKLLEKLQLVSEEAFLHVIQTSFAPDEESVIRVSTQLTSRYFELSFFDQGLPYDASMEKEFQPVSDVESADTAGMELFLIQQFADHVAWVNHGQEGKEFRLQFEIPQQDIFTIINKEEEKPKRKIGY